MFEAIFDKKNLKGTCYFELLAGKYNNSCWNEGSIFIDEEDFALVEDIFEEVNPEYDHYSFVQYNKKQIGIITGKLEKKISQIGDNKFKISGSLFTENYYKVLNEKVESNRDKAKDMIRSIIKWLESVKESEITVMGI